MLKSKFTRVLFFSFLLLFITDSAISSDQAKNEFADNSFSFSSKKKVALNKQAKKFVASYIQKNNADLGIIRRKNKSTFLMIDSIFSKYGLPVELKYLAVIESGLNAEAVSPVGAAGPWQLMPRTAQILGLKVNAKNDERTHYRKSTKAAAIYLRDLYTEFGDWLLVVAAYNSGPGPVYQAMRKSGSKNFWKLQYDLPAESRDHVKKFIATHYYFEGNGSIATLTKSERLDYIKALSPELAVR